MGRREPDDVIPRIRSLADNGILVHGQVVLIPGVNDGQVLKQTVFDLAALHPAVGSLGIVPVGLTRFRQNLPEIPEVTPKLASTCISQVETWRASLRDRLGSSFVYLGDEFYLLAGHEIPPALAYEGFPLVENGVGMVRHLVDLFCSKVHGLDTIRDPPLRVALVTGTLAGPILRDMACRLSRIPGLSVKAIPVENRFFGDRITVSGLLTGADMLAALQSAPQDDVVVLPPNCVNDNGLFLDDLAPGDIARDLGRDVVVGDYDIVETIRRVAEGRSAGPRTPEEPGLVHPYISVSKLDTHTG